MGLLMEKKGQQFRSVGVGALQVNRATQQNLNFSEIQRQLKG